VIEKKVLFLEAISATAARTATSLAGN